MNSGRTSLITSVIVFDLAVTFLICYEKKAHSPK